MADSPRWQVERTSILMDNVFFHKASEARLHPMRSPAASKPFARAMTAQPPRKIPEIFA
ncbi:conserved hypothetical protein [Burkholderia cenocepacia]|nr:conserved hypothetical protein [Burkholderia cenocepacia]